MRLLDIEKCDMTADRTKAGESSEDACWMPSVRRLVNTVDIAAKASDDSCLVLYKYETVSDVISKRYFVYDLINRNIYIENDK